MTETRKQQEYDFKRKLIIDAAKSVFFGNGFENSTMEDIAREAGYSKGSLYSYFDSKNEICFTIVNNYYLKLSDLIQRISEESDTGLNKLIKVKDALIEEFAQNADCCEILNSFKYYRHQCMEADEEIQRNEMYNEKINKLLIDIIQSGIEDHSIRNTVDSGKLAHALWNKETSFITELKSAAANTFDYLFELIVDSIKAEVQ